MTTLFLLALYAMALACGYTFGYCDGRQQMARDLSPDEKL